jgi:hypothetical protein
MCSLTEYFRCKVTAVEFDLRCLRVRRNEILQEETGAKPRKLRDMTISIEWRREDYQKMHCSGHQKEEE